MNPQLSTSHVFFSIGFRPFFLGAAIYAVLSIGLWGSVYSLQMPFDASPLGITQWHAHEMIYGYAMAVIAGFLLTAVSNWTGLPTSSGKPLALMFACWCIARILYLVGPQLWLVASLADLAFMVQLMVVISLPIIKRRLWGRMAIVAKVVLLAAFNVTFVLGALGALNNGIQIGIYGGLFLVVGLILTIGKNLVPFFIVRGVDYHIELSNFRWLDIVSLVAFLTFFILELTQILPQVRGGLALTVFVANMARLAQWHTQGIWTKPLLWSLYLSYGFLCLGFLLIGLHYFSGLSKFIGIHALGVGGIGVITLAMMSRVSIGHTGRAISKPPYLSKIIFATVISCAVTRVILPLVWPSQIGLWMALSFVLWISAFLVFLWVFAPMLWAPRVDQVVS